MTGLTLHPSSIHMVKHNTPKRNKAVDKMSEITATTLNAGKFSVCLESEVMICFQRNTK